jgi:predicted Zn-dependent peptidase
VWAFDLPSQAVISADVVFDIGLNSEPRALEGVAALAADVADEGTTSHPGELFAAAVESAGVMLSTRTTYQSTRLGVDVAADHLEVGLALLTEALWEPVYDAVDVARHVDDELTSLVDMEANPTAKTANAARAALFPTAWRESRRLNGDQETLTRINPAALQSFHDQYWSPAAATLIVAGQLPRDIAAIVQRACSRTPATTAAVPPVSPVLPPVLPVSETATGDAAPTAARHVWVVHHPGAVQSVVNVSCLTPTRGHPDLEPLQIGAIAMGGSFLSRLNRVLREERGFTYGANCSVAPLRNTGVFSAGAKCRPEVTGALLSELLLLLDVSAQPFSTVEINDAIDYAIGVAPLAYDTADAIANQAGGFVANGMSPEWFGVHQNACLQVTPESATAAFNRWIDPEKLHIVVGGDATALVPALAALGLAPTVVDAFGHPVA